MEDEARDVLRRAVGEAPPPKDLGRAIHARFAALGGVDLDLPERGDRRGDGGRAAGRTGHGRRCRRPCGRPPCGRLGGPRPSNGITDARQEVASPGSSIPRLPVSWPIWWTTGRWRHAIATTHWAGNGRKGLATNPRSVESCPEESGERKLPTGRSKPVRLAGTITGFMVTVPTTRAGPADLRR